MDVVRGIGRRCQVFVLVSEETVHLQVPRRAPFRDSDKALCALYAHVGLEVHTENALPYLRLTTTTGFQQSRELTSCLWLGR